MYFKGHLGPLICCKSWFGAYSYLIPPNQHYISNFENAYLVFITDSCETIRALPHWTTNTVAEVRIIEFSIFNILHISPMSKMHHNLIFPYINTCAVLRSRQTPCTNGTKFYKKGIFFLFSCLEHLYTLYRHGDIEMRGSDGFRTSSLTSPPFYYRGEATVFAPQSS